MLQDEPRTGRPKELDYDVLRALVGVVFQHDNARPHVTLRTKEKLQAPPATDTIIYLLGRFDVELKKKLHHLVKKKVLFHHDDAPAHSSAIATAKLVELRYKLLTHPPYFPDLTSSDFFLFPNMKKWLAGKKFTSNSKVITMVDAYLAEFEQSYFLEGINPFELRVFQTNLGSCGVQVERVKPSKKFCILRVYYALQKTILVLIES
ncbi:PREDICTED: uncharacterized protein LOC106751635 [Dinoponera quadriceps]|uniref:Uncharacterized protein LOC106751635 n=1 Tax=Dinoponera quadriceps TaxID=609295 RepID=A0A6P3YDW6_DINQU|nr:PREDICTED: uncharacterized protein LOC106751635 [Dinoponera quadriceps]